MKKHLLFVVYFSFYLHGISQHIADANFARGIRYQCETCIDSANNLTMDAQKLTHLTVSIQNISDLTGIEGFSSLTALVCTNNNLTTLPDKLPTKIQSLNIEYNKITHLRSLPNTLKQLDCSNNELTVLPELPLSLLMLDCSYNKITALPQLNNLTSLFCTNNSLTVLPQLPAGLEGLVCSYNQLKALPSLPKPLIRVSCQYNLDIKCLPLLPQGLVYLDISKNIVCLPNVVKNLTVDMYEGFSARAVDLPICNVLRPLPCDTFPQTMSKDSTDLIKNAHEMTVYPNPTEGGIFIKCINCTLKKVTVFNTIGQLVLKTEWTTVDLSSLGSGMYILRLEATNGYTKVEKIMKM